jgi:UDP-N-acetylglucosamine 1-carboxyvinyltransferase
MSSKIIINGGKPLRGTVTPVANKNSILKLIPACVLAEEPVTLRNVPMSSAVKLFLQVFRQLGGKVVTHRDGSITLDSSTVNTYKIDEVLAEKERATFVFLGPLLARFGKAEISDPGGCKLGNRPLDAMFQGLQALNVKLDKENGYKVYTDGLKGNENIWLVEASVTGTENIILAAVKAKGRTIIYNAACEPHTQDLCNFLVSLGARIEGIGSNRLTIDGVETLHGGEWTVISDHIDIGGWIVATAVTGGEVLIKNAIPQHMTQILNYMGKINVKVEIRGEDIFVPAKQNLECKHNIRGDIDKIPDQPWPGYPVDLIPQILVLATCAKGNIKVLSNMYETQLFFVEELQKMKASLVMSHPHQVITFGPAKLKGSTITAPNILQCVHAVLLAGLAAEGKTTILNADMLMRRYPQIIDSLKQLGADIELVEE